MKVFFLLLLSVIRVQLERGRLPANGNNHTNKNKVSRGPAHPIREVGGNLHGRPIGALPSLDCLLEEVGKNPWKWRYFS